MGHKNLPCGHRLRTPALSLVQSSLLSDVSALHDTMFIIAEYRSVVKQMGHERQLLKW